MIELTDEECGRVLAEADTAYVACLADGEPYVTSMSFVVVDGAVCFRTGEGKRSHALDVDPRVCIVADVATDDGGWRSVIIWGEAEQIDGDRAAEVIAALLHKYRESGFEVSPSQHLPVKRPVYAVAPTRMTGRSSGSLLAPETHPGRF
jgi:nitroimidazol reductase NimA-like FMN-containing flavoprotein (pyridoxamine 5'-phosphate oxidase superfamily)